MRRLPGMLGLLQLSPLDMPVTQEPLLSSSCLQQGYHNAPHGAHRAGYFHSTRLSRPSVHLPRPDVPSGTARVLYPLSSPAPLPPVLSITSSVWVLWVLRDLAARAV